MGEGYAGKSNNLLEQTRPTRYEDRGAVRAALGRGNPECSWFGADQNGANLLDHVVGEPVTYVQAPRC